MQDKNCVCQAKATDQEKSEPIINQETLDKYTHDVNKFLNDRNDVCPVCGCDAWANRNGQILCAICGTWWRPITSSIIRCKECLHSDGHTSFSADKIYCRELNRYMAENDFCSHGKSNE